MRYSRMLLPTARQVPAEAEISSHQLMIRAGLIRKLASGTYTYLPLGFRCLRKVIDIVREEMNKAGAQEILMPSVQPMELWSRTGRDIDYGPTMAHFTDRHGRENVLAPTAEEVVTTLAANEINSYKQLPFNIYQVSFKFRDEFRPRFGVLRSREFIMKDAYSFHADPKSLDDEYQNMYETYKRIFARCGLPYLIVEAESGEMGGTGSHQFTIPCSSGEDVIVYTEDGSYAANLEKAAVDPPSVILSEAKNLPAPEDIHTPNVGSIDAVCKFLKTKPKDMIKTLVLRTPKFPTEVLKHIAAEEAKHDGREALMGPKEGWVPKTILALIRGDHELNMEKLMGVWGGPHLEMADEETIERYTGAKVGFAGPVGINPDNWDLIAIDHAVAAMPIGVTGANKTDYHTKNIVPGRDFPLEGNNIIVADIRNAVEGDTHDGKPLLFKRGIEVGQVFKLGTKYSEKLGCKFLDENGKENPCLMGCYGIGINRIVASVIETGNDKNGIVWPISIAPFEVIIVAVNADEPDVTRTAEEIYTKLTDAGVDVLLDDREERAGVKFKDADLIGIPVRVTVGKKALADNSVEIKRRAEKEVEKVPVADAVTRVVEIVNALKAKLTV